MELHQEIRGRFRASKTDKALGSFFVFFSTDSSKAVLFVRASVLLYETFVLALFVPRYATNFEEVGGAYCLWVVRPSVVMLFGA